MAVTPLAADLPAARPALIVIAYLASGSWPAGGAAVTADTPSGNNGAVGSPTLFGTVFSAGGGAASVTTAAHSGAGAFYGGGGGGASLNGNNSGAGGNGGPGLALIITHFA